MVTTAPLGLIELRLLDGRLKVYRSDLDPTAPLAELVLELIQPGREPESFHPVRLNSVVGGFELHSHLWDVLSLEARFELFPKINGVAMKLKLSNPSERLACRIRVGLRGVPGRGPRWMIPGIFYKHNRVGKCRRVYPAFDPGVTDPARMVSTSWSFRSDRAATPAVFVWTSEVGAFFVTDERAGVSDQFRMGVGMTGIYFDSGKGPTEIGMTLPYAETPVKFSYCHADRTDPQETLLHLEKGQTIEWECCFGVGTKDLHSYDAVLRANLDRITPQHPIRPWMRGEDAEGLVAQALLAWHSNPDDGILYETTVFDKSFGKMGSYIHRASMHTGWTGGAPIAYAMLLRGEDQSDPQLINAAFGILDRIASQLAPTGTFWGEWNSEAGWATGLNPDPEWIHARTAADATLYLLRALRIRVQKGESRPAWLNAIQSNLDYVVKIQRNDGNLGACYHLLTGNVAEWDGCAGMAWIPPLVAASSFLYEKRYIDAALKAGKYYEQFVHDEFLYGSAEDQFLTPTVEDGVSALLAYVLLYELDRSDRWLKLAQRAAEWMLTFRYTYNVTFSKTTLLGAYGFRTRGADISSPANHTLHPYALFAYPELVKLSHLTGDPYYSNRAEEQRICFLQMIAREDGDFGARKGMIPGQIYQTDSWQPKGRVLDLCHSWGLGAVLYANIHSRHAFSTEIAAGRPDRRRKTATHAEPPPKGDTFPIGGSLDRPWAPTDHRDTQDITVQWKIF